MNIPEPIGTALQEPTVRGIAITLGALLLTEIVKQLAKRYANNKGVLRGIVLVVCAGGAFAATWGPDGEVTFAEWWGLFWPTVTTAEFSYQWVLKTLGQWRRDVARMKDATAVDDLKGGKSNGGTA